MGVFLLFVAAMLLFIVLTPIGFLFTILINLFKSYTYLFYICIGLDKLGNVIMAALFNIILIKKEGHPFGNINETISSVLGKNQLSDTLLAPGKLLNNFLSLIQKNHSVQSIEEVIKIPD
jgi:8-oxo-dGTP diphosphatase